MDFYSGTIPNLISDRIKNSMDGLSHVTGGSNDMFKKVYDDYIKPNLFLLILICIIGLFLYYRYTSKQESFDEKLMDRPIFNPRVPVSRQKSYVNYLPDQVPVRSKGELVNNVGSDIVIDPEYTPNHSQFTGPTYRTTGDIVSDDTIIDFVLMNQQNVTDFNSMVDQRTNI